MTIKLYQYATREMHIMSCKAELAEFVFTRTGRMPQKKSTIKNIIGLLPPNEYLWWNKEAKEMLR